MRIQIPKFWRVAPLLLAACTSSVTTARAIQPVSIAGAAIAPPAGGGGDSVAPILSPNARFILFTSTANNLSVTSSNTPYRAASSPRLNVFLRDRTNGTTALVSINTSGSGGGNGDTIGTEISTNGQFALFESSASDLVTGDTNKLNDVFVRDLLTNTTRLVSASTNGTAANGASQGSAMTPDGRYVAFVSLASNLVLDDTNGIADVFVADLQSNTMTLVSVGAMSTSTPAANGSSEAPDITPDGRYVAFFSTATNLLPGVTKSGNLYVRDLVAGITQHANTNAVPSSHTISEDGKYIAFQARQTNNSAIILRFNRENSLMDLVHSNAYALPTTAYDNSRRLDMSPDGRFIAFVANTNLPATGSTCVLVWDAQTDQSTLGSAVPSSGATLCDWPTIDPTGRFVAFFISYGGNFFTNYQTVYPYFLYVRDLQAGTNWLVNANSNGVVCNVSATALSRLSANGRGISFQAPDGTLTPGDRNRYEDVFLSDVTVKKAELVSTRHSALPSLTPNGSSGNSAFGVNADGRYVAFASEGNNLTGNDTNQCQDVFLRDRLAGTNYLVSVSSSQYTNASTEPSISADGRYVAHVVYPYGGTSIPYPRNVYVRDTLTGSNRLVSVNSFGGSTVGNGPSYSPLLSADGQRVLFRSTATDLVSPSVSGENLFYRSLQYSNNRALTTYAIRSASMTPDGRWVAYIGAIYAGTTNLFVWDSQSATRVYTNTSLGLAQVSISPDGNRLAYATTSQLFAADWGANSNWLVGAMTLSPRVGMRFSADGRFLAYACTNALLAADTNKTYDVYLHDFQTGSNLLVSHSYGSTNAGHDASDFPDLSPDGRLVTYRSDASNLVPTDNNGAGDIFLFDRLTGNTTLLSVNKAGNASANGWSSSPQFTRDGRKVFFKTWAPDVTDNDFNGGSDLFAYAIFYAEIVPGDLPAFGPTLSWPVEAGKTYQVQFLDDLNLTNWQNAGGSVTIVNDWANFTDPSAGAGQRYYRIVAN